MYIMFSDETNQQPSSESRFFIYGGVIFPLHHLGDVHNNVKEIREEAGYLPRDKFKFDTHTRPEYVSPEEVKKAKNKVIEMCLNMECKFIAHIIHHDVIRGQDADQQVHWAADYVIGKYNQFLSEFDDVGLCIIDNLPGGIEFRYITEKFSNGLTLHDGYIIDLDRIIGFASTRIGASHAHSVADIVLGCFRYVVNNPVNIEAAEIMARNVAKLMWAETRDGTDYVRDRGLIYRPPLEAIRSSRIRKEYQDLINRLDELTNS